jgi:hypothetical protein
VFAGFAKVYAITHLGDSDKAVEKIFKYVTIEKVGVAGLAVLITGALLFIHILAQSHLPHYYAASKIKDAMIAFVFVVLGIQTFFSSFMFSILGIKEK